MQSAKTFFSNASMPSRVTKVLSAGALTAFLSACGASMPTKYTYVDEVSPTCSNLRRHINFIPAEEGAEGNTKQEQMELVSGKIVDQYVEKIGFDNSCANLRVLVATALTRDDSEVGIIAKLAVLKMVASQDPTVRNSIYSAVNYHNASLQEFEDQVDNYYGSLKSQNLRRMCLTEETVLEDGTTVLNVDCSHLNNE